MYVSGRQLALCIRLDLVRLLASSSTCQQQQGSLCHGIGRNLLQCIGMSILEGRRCGWHAGLRGGISVTVIALLPQVNDVLGYAWPKNAGLCPGCHLLCLGEQHAEMTKQPCVVWVG